LDIYTRLWLGIIEKYKLSPVPLTPVNMPGGAGAVALTYLYSQDGDPQQQGPLIARCPLAAMTRRLGRAATPLRPASKPPAPQESPAFSLTALTDSGRPETSDPLASATRIGIRNPITHGASIRFWARAISARTRLPR
jgi:hypothetical protein